MPDNLNIVKFIEKNPNSRLSKNYQNELVNKIKKEFTEPEQQLFLGSFYCFLNHDSKRDFVIDLDDVWKWLGFSRKDPAKVVITKNFVEDLDYKIISKIILKNNEENTLQKSLEQNKDKHGGQNKETILMTVNTFKKFCLKAGTKKADQIHDYYIKLEELLQETINEETNEMRNQLLVKENEIQKNKSKVKLDKQKILIDKMRTKKCVYIGEIEENKFIKIGSSKNVDTRIYGLQESFGNFIFLEIFECENYREVEEDILKDPTIIKNLYKEPINNYNSKEVVKLSDELNYEQLLAIVKKYLNKIYLLSPEQLLEKERLTLEKEKLALEKEKIEIENKKLDYDFISNLIMKDKTKKTNKILEINDEFKEKFSNILQNIEKKIINLNNDKGDSNKEDDNQKSQKQNIFFNPYNDDRTKLKLKIKGTHKKGRKIQKIDPKNLKKVVKVYESIGYVLRDPEHIGFQSKSLQDALNNHKIYRDFRWRYVGENEDSNNCEKVEPTFEYKHPTSPTDSILELNSTKTEITNSFSTRGLLAKELNISSGKLLKIISKNLMHNEHYYIELNKCPQELLDKYDKPIKRHSFKNAKKIKQINPITKQTVIFNSLSDLYRKYGYIGRTVIKAIDEKVVYHGYLWEYYND
jgi:hypothetical protein